MDTGIIFLLGVYFVPLALVSAIAAWADGRRPYMALGLAAVAMGLVLLASALRTDGSYGLRDIPLLSVEYLVRIWQAF